MTEATESLPNPTKKKTQAALQKIINTGVCL